MLDVIKSIKKSIDSSILFSTYFSCSFFFCASFALIRCPLYLSHPFGGINGSQSTITLQWQALNDADGVRGNELRT